MEQFNTSFFSHLKSTLLGITRNSPKTSTQKSENVIDKPIKFIRSIIDSELGENTAYRNSLGNLRHNPTLINPRGIPPTGKQYNESMKGFNDISIIEDGNCLFRALAYGLKHNQSEHTFIRTLICSNIESNFEVYRQLFLINQNYVSTMSQDTIWGGEIEIFAAVNTFQISIFLVQDGQPTMEYQPQPELFLQNNDYQVKNEYSSIGHNELSQCHCNNNCNFCMKKSGRSVPFIVIRYNKSHYWVLEVERSKKMSLTIEDCRKLFNISSNPL